MRNRILSSSARICSRCVMDTTDPFIVFDPDTGECNHCKNYDRKVKEFVIDGPVGLDKAMDIANRIVSVRYDQKYDCLIGLSGGVDSSYLACRLYEFGLKPLAVHFDNGWNSMTGVTNIKKVLDYCDMDLKTLVVNWPEFRDLQLSFIKAGVPDLEIPSDHAIVSLQNKFALKEGIPFIMSGANVRTEGHVPAAWSQGHWDWRYIKHVHKYFGTKKLKTFPAMSLIDLVSVKWIRLLNYLDYDRDHAKKWLMDNIGWQDYGWKHHESIYTRFYQAYILPVRFGYDKRKSHLSTLICSGKITREQAWENLAEGNHYDPDLMKQDKEFVLKKLGFSETEFSYYMHMPKKSYHDFPNNGWILKSKLFQRIYQKYTKM